MTQIKFLIGGWRLIYLPIFIALITFSACDENNGTSDVYSQLNKQESFKCNLQAVSNEMTDSIVLNIPEKGHTINSNVPFKIIGENLFVLTNENTIFVYPTTMLKEQEPINPIQTIELPKNLEGIADFSFINNGESILISTMGSLVLNFFGLEQKTDTILNGGRFVFNMMPYIGHTATKKNNHYILPITKIDDFMNGNFLGIYNKDLEYLKGTGNSGYTNQKCKLPYYDTPIISNFTDNNTFYVSFSSSNKILKCHLTDEYEIKYDAVYETEDFSNSSRNCISEDQLYNYKFLNELYVTERYWLSLVAQKDKIYRIEKKNQFYINSQTRKKNTMLDAGWSLNITNVKTKITRKMEFPPGQFLYLSGFLFKDSYYVPKKMSNDKIVIYGFN